MNSASPRMIDLESPQIIYSSMMQRMDTHGIKLKTSKLLEKVIRTLMKYPMPHTISTNCSQKTYGQSQAVNTEIKPKDSSMFMKKFHSNHLKQKTHDLQDKYKNRMDRSKEIERQIVKTRLQHYKSDNYLRNSDKNVTISNHSYQKERISLNFNDSTEKAPKRYQKYLDKLTKRNRYQ